MKRPLIGITMDTTDSGRNYMLAFDYPRSIDRAGGIPFPLPYKTDLSLIPTYVDLIDGMLFSGGNDLDPSTYCEEPWHPKAAPIDPDRQKFEMALMAEVEKRRVPTLGVCLGSQVMNVYRGGSLTQFLPDHERDDALEHRCVSGVSLRHDVKLDTSSQLGRAIGGGESNVSVNTFHKQAVRKIGRGLKIIATAPDGVIEGFEDPSLPLFAAVQWHPERLVDEREHLAPFKLLVEKSAETAKR